MGKSLLMVAFLVLLSHAKARDIVPKDHGALAPAENSERAVNSAASPTAAAGVDDQKNFIAFGGVGGWAGVGGAVGVIPILGGVGTLPGGLGGLGGTGGILP